MLETREHGGKEPDSGRSTLANMENGNEGDLQESVGGNNGAGWGVGIESTTQLGARLEKAVAGMEGTRISVAQRTHYTMGHSRT